MHRDFIKRGFDSSINEPNHVCAASVMLDFTVTVTLKSALADRIAVEHVLFNILNSFESFTYEKHKEKEQKFANRATINIYLNNKRKLSTDSVMKDEVKTFKKEKEKNNSK